MNGETWKRIPGWLWYLAGALAGVGVLFLALIVLAVVGAYAFQIPFHLLVGWMIHAWKVPGLLKIDPLTLGSSGAAMLVTWWLGHRFISWYRTCRGSPPTWKALHTLSVLFLLLAGAAAAISLSGVVHQWVWLKQGPMTRSSRTKDTEDELKRAANDLLAGLILYKDDHGKYPMSWQEFFASTDYPRDEVWLPRRMDSRKASDLFVLLAPGRSAASSGSRPIAMSIAYTNEGDWILVAYNDGTVVREPADTLDKIIERARIP